MSQFVSVCSGSAEAVRKRNPAETLYELIITLQLYLTSQGKYYKLLDDKEFVTLKNTLDARMKELSATGKRVKRKQAGTISYEEEDSLCRKGILGLIPPIYGIRRSLSVIGSITEVKQRRARFIIGWVTAW